MLETLRIWHYFARSNNVSSADNQQERPGNMREDVPDQVGYYLAGFVDGEGSFNISIKKAKDRSLGWRVTACFNVSQKERHILDVLQEALGCGTIRQRWDGVHYFEVNSYFDLAEKVIPFFHRFPLLSPNKGETLEIFTKICEMMCAREHLSLDGIQQIIHLRKQMNNETSKRHRDDEEILKSLI